MPDEIVLRLSAAQAASGLTVTLRPEEDGDAVTFRIPPVKDGALLRVPSPTGELRVRIRVSPAEASRADSMPRGPFRSPAAVKAWLAVGVLAMVCFAILGVISSIYGGSSDDGAPEAAPSSAHEFAVGDCLSGILPDGSTDQPRVDVTLVPCSSPDARYQVTQKFYGSLAECSSGYPFIEETLFNGIPLSSMSYCAVRTVPHASQ
jgi:hypothetical protein